MESYEALVDSLAAGQSDSITLPALASEHVNAPDAGTVAAIVRYCARLLSSGRPRRLARMSMPGETKRYKNSKTRQWETVARGKYEDVFDISLEEALLEHACGTKTFATTIDADGMARSGAVDIDNGRDYLRSLLQTATDAGLTGYILEMETPGGHVGGHFRLEFKQTCPVVDIEHLLRHLVRQAGVPGWQECEVWPGSNQSIRWPFGIHQLTGSRGVLMTPAGERYLLDDHTQLAAAVAFASDLPPNDPPPAAPIKPPPRPVTWDDVQPERPITKAPATTYASRFEKSATAIDTINRREDLIAYLERRGGGVASNTADGKLMQCPCGQHTHGDEHPSLEIKPDRKGVPCAIGSAPNCVFYHGHRKRWDFCAVVAALEGISLRDVVKRYSEPYPPQKRAEPPPPETPEYLLPQVIEARRRDAERKRVARQVETETTLTAARAWHDSNTLTERAQTLLDLLIDECERKHSASCRMSNERAAAALGKSERTIQRAFNDLLALGVGHRSGGSNIGGKSVVPTWVFSPNLPSRADATRVTDRTETQSIASAEETPATDALGSSAPPLDSARMTAPGASLDSARMTEGDFRHAALVTLHAYKNTYSIEDLGACERAPAPPASGDTADTWQWHDPPIGADVLDQALLSPPPDPDQLTRARALASRLGGTALLVDYWLMADAELEEAIECLCAQLAQKEADKSDETVIIGPDGATYFPGGAAWLPTIASVRWYEAHLPPLVATREVDTPAEGEQAVADNADDVVQPPPPAPHRWPPSDPQRARQYFGLLGKAHKIQKSNPRQAALLRRKAHEMEELRYDDVAAKDMLREDGGRAHKLRASSSWTQQPLLV